MTTDQSLGQRIAQSRRELAVRERRDITQADVAEAVGVSRTSVSEWEADLKVPREGALAKLAQFLGVTPGYLRYGLRDTADVVYVDDIPVDRRSLRRFTEAELRAAMQQVAEETPPAPETATPPKAKAHGGKRRR